MTSHRRVAGLGAAIAIALVLVGCSGGATLKTVGQAVDAQREAAIPAASAAAPAAPADAGTFSGATGESGSSVGPAAYDPNVDQALIVKTGSMTLDVGDLDAALLKAQAAVTAAGGYVSGSDRAGQGGQQVATVTYRIPAAAWDRTLVAVRAVGSRVEKEQTNTVEVTGQVVDLGARIANLRVTEAALQAIMAKATKIPDVLAVQQQLTDVQGQIEELTAQKQHLQQQAAMSTLSVTFQVPVVAVTTAASGWDLGSQVDQATAQLIELAQGIASGAIWLGIVVLPLVLVALAVLVPAAWLARRLAARVRPVHGPGQPMWGPGAGTPPA